jgi:transcription antitermination factor NusG
MEMAKGYMENDKITIKEDPLENFAGRIKKIDRHKR